MGFLIEDLLYIGTHYLHSDLTVYNTIDLQAAGAKGVSISSRLLSARSERNGKRALLPTREYSLRKFSMVWS